MAPRRSLLRAFTGRFAIALVVTSVFMVGAIASVNTVIDNKIAGVDRVNVAVAHGSAKGGNFLLIGSDTRAFVKSADQQKQFGGQGTAGGQRSDTMMVVHVDPDQRKTLIVSFPRDLWVQIPGVGGSKINAAFNNGPNKTVETLKSNFGININHYLEVDFESFRGVVQAIGSVPVYFPFPARDDKTGLYVATPGCMKLNGDAALAYVRSRELQYFSIPKSRWLPADAVPDIDRIARQQDFMRKIAALAVAKSLNDPITANDITDQVLGHLKIDGSLTKDDIFALVDVFRTINPGDQTALEFVTLPWMNGPRQNGASVLYPKEPDAKALIARLRRFGKSSRSTSSTTSPSSTSASSSIPPGAVTTTTGAAVPPLSPTPAPITNQSQLGAPAPRTAPC